MPSALVLMLLLSFSVYWTIVAVRTLPGISVLVRRGVKPLACHLCMSFWMPLTHTAAIVWLFDLHLSYPLSTHPSVLAYLLVPPAAAGAAYALLRYNDLASPPPPSKFPGEE